MDFYKSKGIQKTSNPWYWEAGHFKHELGSLILAQVFWTTSQSAKLGNPIENPMNVENVIAKQRVLSAVYRQLHHQEFIELEKILVQ